MRAGETESRHRQCAAGLIKDLLLLGERSRRSIIVTASDLPEVRSRALLGVASLASTPQRQTQLVERRHVILQPSEANMRDSTNSPLIPGAGAARRAKSTEDPTRERTHLPQKGLPHHPEPKEVERESGKSNRRSGHFGE